MHIDEAVARMVLHKDPIEDLPGIATEALCHGFDSPALRMLAASAPSDHPDDLRRLFTKAAQELGIAIPDKVGAARALLPLYLRDIAQAIVSPAQGVRRILYDLHYPLGHDLDKSHVGEGLGIGKLVGDYYTYDDAASGRLEFRGRRVTKDEAFEILDRSIVDEAKRLLREAELGAAPNCGPATPNDNSNVQEGPQSVT